MTIARHVLTSFAAAALAAGAAGGALASETYVFPGTGGIAIAAPPQFAPASEAKFTLAFVPGVPADAMVPLPPVSPSYSGRFPSTDRATEAYAYRFFTHALSSQSYSNYAADYDRIFAPGRAVSTWTDRMFGLIDAGYGGAVDGWTAASYYMGRVRGPVRRRETAPDLSIMPTFRAHPELSAPPTFNKTN